MSMSIELQRQLSHALSPARLSTYEAVTPNFETAIQLYKWNAEISGSFWTALQLCEIVIRNAVNSALIQLYGGNWAWQTSFINSLPPARQVDLLSAKRGVHTINKVIPELKFFFWQKMLTSRYDFRLWNKYLEQAFPNMDKSLSVSQRRQMLYGKLEKIRTLRNRIAHHEPIFHRNLQEDYTTIYEVIACCSQSTADWLDSLQKITQSLPHNPLNHQASQP